MYKKGLLFFLLQVMILGLFCQAINAGTVNKTTSNIRIPKELYGNWFEKEGKEIWKLGLFDSVAIYNNCLWHYESMMQKTGIWQISLLPIGKSPNKSTSIELRPDKGGIVWISEKLQNPIACIANPTKKSMNAAPTEKPFPNPFFKHGKAIIQGYVEGYKYENTKPFTEEPEKPFIIYSLSSALASTQKDGVFSLELSLAHPQLVGVWIVTGNINGRKSYSYKYFYLEPGSTVTSFIASKDSLITDNPFLHKQLFMGNEAEISASENYFAALRNNRRNRTSFDYNNQLDYESYKTKCQEIYKDNDDLAITYLTAGQISEKAFKMAHITNQVDYLRRLIDYNKANVRFQKAKQLEIHDATNQVVTMEETNNPEKNTLLPSTSYRLLPNLNKEKKFTYSDIAPIGQCLRDTLSLLSDQYLTLLNSLNELREFSTNTLNMSNVIELMKERGIEITPEEERAYQFFKEKKEVDSYTKSDIDSLTFYSSSFKEKRKKLVEKFASEMEETKKDGSIFFWLRLPSFASLEKRANATVVTMSFKTPGSKNVAEILDSRVYRQVVDDYEEIFDKVKSTSNAGKVDSRLGKVPQAERGAFFGALLEEYRGKVVLIDFWATWCVPCKNGMERMASLKAYLKDSSVAFICIAHESSPIDDWNELRKKYQGIHYRLEGDEYKELNIRFNIKTIPRLILVDKSGNVVNKNVGHQSNEELYKMIKKYMDIQEN